MKKYPLLLKPVIKDYLWGGTRLKEEYGFETEKDIAAEGWMLASHKDGTNVVLNGEYAGQTFDEVRKLWGEEKTRFPLLIKLIDAKDKLSIQVHPEDSFAVLGGWITQNGLPISVSKIGVNLMIELYQY